MSDQVGHIIDVWPTIAEVGRAGCPKEFAGQQVIPVEGISLVPVFEGSQRAGQEMLRCEFAGNRSVREGDWQLCWDKKVKTWEL